MAAAAPPKRRTTKRRTARGRRRKPKPGSGAGDLVKGVLALLFLVALVAEPGLIQWLGERVATLFVG